MTFLERSKPHGAVQRLPASLTFMSATKRESPQISSYTEKITQCISPAAQQSVSDGADADTHQPPCHSTRPARWHRRQRHTPAEQLHTACRRPLCLVWCSVWCARCETGVWDAMCGRGGLGDVSCSLCRRTEATRVIGPRNPVTCQAASLRPTNALVAYSTLVEHETGLILAARRAEESQSCFSSHTTHLSRCSGT